MTKQSTNKSSLIPKNVLVDGRRTSIRFEVLMWQALALMAKHKGCSIHTLCSNAAKSEFAVGGLTSAVRMYILNYFMYEAAKNNSKGKPLSKR